MTARVKIYTTEFCGYCVAAKNLLKRREIAFEELSATGVRDWLIETTGQRTVPQIFLDERPIGGYTELAALDRSGQLVAYSNSGASAGFGG